MPVLTRVALGWLGALAAIAATLWAPSPAAAAGTFTLTCTQTGGDTTTPYSITVDSVVNHNEASGCGGVATIPEGVTSLEWRPFTQDDTATNPHITSIVFPSTLTTIGIVGLQNLTGVTSLTIPASVTNFSSQAMPGMTGLSTLRIEGSSTTTTTVGYYALQWATIDLHVGNGSVTFNSTAMNDATIQSLTIDDTGSGSVSFGPESFKNQPLTSLTVPPRVTSIGDRAFSNNASLTEVDFGATTPGLTSIHADAFQNTPIASVRYCGGNTVLDAYLTASLPNADVFCSPTQVPSTPTIASTSVGDSSVTITATPGAANDGRALSNYAVQYSPDGNTWTTYTRTPASTNPSITVPSLTNGTGYQFKVAAVSLAGASSYSTPSASVTPRTLPGGPTGVTGTPGNGQVAVTWSAPGSDGGAAISDYIVEWRESAGPGAWTTFADGISTATAATVTGLTIGTAYDFRVAAVNVTGTGAFSAPSPSIVPAYAPPPSPPQPPTLAISPAAQVLSGIVGEPVTATAPFTLANFTLIPRYSIYPLLPEGLSLDPGTGVVSGMPTEAYTSTRHWITATAGGGSESAYSTLQLSVGPAPTPAPTPVMSVTGSGREEAGPRRVFVSLSTRGIAPGSQVQPWVIRADNSLARPGKPVTVGADGTVTWSRRTRVDLTVWFAHGDVVSLRVALPGR